MQIVPDFFEMEPDMEDWCPQHTLLLPLELVSTVSFCRHTSKPKSPSRTVRTTGLPEKWEFEKEAAKLFVLSLMTAMSAGFIVFIFYCVFFVWYCWTLGPKCIFFFFSSFDLYALFEIHCVAVLYVHSFLVSENSVTKQTYTLYTFNLHLVLINTRTWNKDEAVFYFLQEIL